MISVRIEDEKQNDVTEYPKLMKANNDLIVLFTAANKGIVLVSNNAEEFNVGHYSEDWYIPAFKDFNHPITLQNKVD